VREQDRGHAHVHTHTHERAGMLVLCKTPQAHILAASVSHLSAYAWIRPDSRVRSGHSTELLNRVIAPGAAKNALTSNDASMLCNCASTVLSLVIAAKMDSLAGYGSESKRVRMAGVMMVPHEPTSSTFSGVGGCGIGCGRCCGGRCCGGHCCGGHCCGGHCCGGGCHIDDGCAACRPNGSSSSLS
jgi:hypothetical protein